MKRALARPASYESPRAWMKWYFEKNAAGFRKDASASDDVDWTRPGILVGSICFRAVFESVICAAAGEDELSREFLLRGEALLRHAVERFWANVEMDRHDLDRVQMALAARLGGVLSRSGFLTVETPFDAFPRYIEAALDLEARNATQVLWALFAIFEGNEREYESARDLKQRLHGDLRDEMAMVPILADLVKDPAHPGWGEYERVLARWLNPILKTESYASNFQDHFGASLVLVWVKYHLQRLDRETVLKTYFGEGLTVPMVVA